MYLDIDSFPIVCKDPVSRVYIQEAVAAYKAGAYRATITYTWLAIVINLINKIEKLAILGDKEALSIKGKLDKIRQTNDISGMLNFEKTILKVARKKFELFDDIVLIDLLRIQEDRNRCSHPLIHSDGQIYSPTPEQSKNHIYVAVDKLLKEENVYGQFVIDKIIDLIDSEVFPLRLDEAFQVLDGGYLSSPKSSLVRNLFIVILKDMINENLDFKKKSARRAVIQYLINTNRYLIEQVLNEKLDALNVFQDTIKLQRYLSLLSIDKMFLLVFPDDKKILIKSFARESPIANIVFLVGLEEYDWLTEVIELRVSRLKQKEILGILDGFFVMPYNLCERIIELYINSQSFGIANDFALAVETAIDWVDERLITSLIVGVGKNDQVSHSHTWKRVRSSIKASKKISEEQLYRLFKENGLE